MRLQRPYRGTSRLQLIIEKEKLDNERFLRRPDTVRSLRALAPLQHEPLDFRLSTPQPVEVGRTPPLAP